MTLTVVSECGPECGAMQWLVSAEPADAVAEWIDGAGGQTSCASYSEPDPDVTPLHVRLRCDALGPVTFRVEGVSPRGTLCDAECTITVNQCVDLDVDSNNDNAIDFVNGPEGGDDPIEAADFSATTPGKWLWVNNDDSNTDGTQDNLGSDAGGIDGVFDLKDIFELIIRPTPASAFPPGARLYIETDLPDRLRVFECRTSDCASALLGPGLPSRSEIGLSSIERMFGFEGCARGHVRLRLELEDALGNLICEDEVGVTVVEVISLDWTAYGDNTPLDNCPNNTTPPAGPSKRIFPDRITYVDQDASTRNLVTLRAEIEPSVQGVIVYFRTWDVDDPFDQDHGSSSSDPVPMVQDVDNDARGPDNALGDLQTDPGIIFRSEQTDVVGVVTVDVPLSLQPGNNYRAGASCMFDGVDDSIVEQPDADSNIAPAPVRFSDMLTVWRQVWLDLDSMGAGADISYTGEIVGMDDDIPHAGDGRVNLNVPDLGDSGRFEGGTLSVINGASYTLLGNADSPPDHYYITEQLVAPQYLWSNGTVKDDDTAVLPRTPNADMTILHQKFQYCYLEFREDPATRDYDNTFIATLSVAPDVLAQLGLENADYSPAEDFWSTVIVTAYQTHAPLPGAAGSTDGIVSPADGDPDRVYHKHTGFSVTGDTRGILGYTVPLAENVCGIYWECQMDYVVQAADNQWIGHTPRDIAFVEPRVIAHELAHAMGFLGHTPGTLVYPWDGSDQELNGTQLRYIRVGTSLSSNTN